MQLRTSSRITPAQAAGIIIAIILGGVVWWFAANTGLWSKVWVVMSHNFSPWVVMFMGIAFPLWRRFKNPVQFTWFEAGVQLTVQSLAVLLFYGVFFYAATDLADNEIWNGFVKRIEYQEEYDTESCSDECDSRDKDGNCTSSHEVCTCSTTPPSWEIETSNDGDLSDPAVDISKADYANIKARFGTPERYIGSKGDHCNFHAGNTYEVVYNNDPAKRIPTAVVHRFANYLRASKATIMKRTGGNAVGFEKFLRPYPTVHEGQFGGIEIDRVIDAEARVPRDWMQKVDQGLDQMLATRGHEHQVNTMVYIAGTGDSAFVQALEEYWLWGKKNDFIVVIGAPQFPKIEWVHVIAFWTDVEEFSIELRDNITKLQTLDGKEDVLVSLVGAQIDKGPASNGWRRKPMSEYAYMAGDINLPWWAHVLVIILSGLLSALCSWALENNEFRDWAMQAAQRITPRKWR